MAEQAPDATSTANLTGKQHEEQKLSAKKEPSPARAVLQTTAGEMIQRSVQLLPTGSNVKMWAKYGDYAVKSEIIYNQIINMIYWSSMGEIALCVFFKIKNLARSLLDYLFCKILILCGLQQFMEFIFSEELLE